MENNDSSPALGGRSRVPAALPPVATNQPNCVVSPYLFVCSSNPFPFFSRISRWPAHPTPQYTPRLQQFGLWLIANGHRQALESRATLPLLSSPYSTPSRLLPRDVATATIRGLPAS